MAVYIFGIRIKESRLAIYLLGSILIFYLLFKDGSSGGDDDEGQLFTPQSGNEKQVKQQPEVQEPAAFDRWGGASLKKPDQENNYIKSKDEVLQKQLMTQEKKNKKKSKKDPACVSYLDYSQIPHYPLSNGPLQLPYMRPPEKCRTFKSTVIDELVDDFVNKMKDPDLARILENSLPNTLDTTILWHKKSSASSSSSSTEKKPNNNVLVNYRDLAKTFVVTGDIHAEWLRDSTRQLSVYQPYVTKDADLKELIKGAINLQSYYILKAPYCNAFHPPDESKVKKDKSAIDLVSPRPPWHTVFECKWELDSLASFLTLTNDYFENTHRKDISIFNEIWLDAFEMILTILRRQSSPTFDDTTGEVLPFYYTFQRDTNIGTETLPLAGTGNPVKGGTGLIRSSFRPSDDACIYQYFIPAKAHMLVELKRIRPVLANVLKQEALTKAVDQFIEDISTGITKHGIVEHPKYGKIYAYEVDGYGSANLMDDANIPSLLALADMGYTDYQTDPIYQNTRKFVMSNDNPYYLHGRFFKGVGGPHIGIHNAWPMSLLVAIRTTDDDNEILEYLDLLKHTTAGLGLMHESINVNYPKGYVYTRPWFAWCNSEFGKTILDLAERKPHLIFA